MANRQRPSKNRPRAGTPKIVRIPDLDISNEQHPLANQSPEIRGQARQSAIASVLARLAENHAGDEKTPASDEHSEYGENVE